MKPHHLLAAAALLAGAVWAADRVSYLTDDPYHRDVVTITSDAPLEYMVTRSQSVRGNVSFDPANLLHEPAARFEVPVDSLTTGILLRDQHLRGEQWLNAGEFPLIVFTLKSIKSPTVPTALQPGRPQELDVVGTLEMRGKAVDLPAVVRVTWLPADAETATRLPGDLLRVDASFDLLLSDFGLVLPEQAVKKLANRQQVEVRLFAATERLVPAEEH